MAALEVMPVTPVFLVGVVYDGATTLKLDFDPIDGVAPDANVGVFKTLVLGKIRPLPEFAHVTLTGQMFVYGPWPSADDVPEDVARATRGRGRAPTVLLSALYDGPASDLFFLVRVPAPPSGAPLPRVRVIARAVK